MVNLKIEERCPICDMPLRYCECANKSILSEEEQRCLQVALEHLYLLSTEQIRHLIEIERVWEIGYTDNREKIVEQLRMEEAERLKEQAEERERDISTEPPKLEPCPRCGMVKLHMMHDGGYKVNCSCGLAWNLILGWKKTRKDAIEQWNKIVKVYRENLAEEAEQKEQAERNGIHIISKTYRISEEEIKRLCTPTGGLSNDNS